MMRHIFLNLRVLKILSRKNHDGCCCVPAHPARDCVAESRILAAEQRTILAHGDSRGFRVRQIIKPRQGRKKTGEDYVNIFFCPCRGFFLFFV
jgi:hypothetical protein